MKDTSNHGFGSATKLRFKKSIWVLFVFLVLIVMIIPSIIIMFFGAGTASVHFNELFTASKQNQASSRFNSNQIANNTSSQKSPLDIGWISGNSINIQHLADYHNLKVVSPELAAIDNQFNLQVISAPSLTNTIRQQGKRIWTRVIIGRDTYTNVHTFLTNSKKIQEVIVKIIQSAKSNHWDGVNVDIENVSSEDRNAFSQFVKTLSDGLNKSSVILSIDLPPETIGSNNKGTPFDHELLGRYCNYIIFMGYDQHWSTDPIPGPITSLSWLKENLQEYLQTGIPAEKLILGLPAYTRIWEQNHQDHVVKNPAEPLQYVEKLVAQNHRNFSWDSTLGEYFISYTAQNVQYKIWLPTAKSFNLYLDLIPQLHLAGSAVWDLNQMNSAYWNEIF
ncbi:glycosyl hydrolase family 18 protein [Neobacillus ginsengisoli]|uniref:Spore germination protein YaaH n=1 Tax=Neobacillus ginsengisoli TaxID=904295 RepID=A0ABT9Y0Q2_9BACI|nr:glycosyl hydrolase family 18 protein [Neobacillus ginsengisoli]MDQ0201412.1 spore germination protein YaaH [Neobacillus ginsengisoli]